MHTYKITLYKDGGSGFTIYLVAADSESEAKNTLKEKTIYKHLPNIYIIEEIKILNDKNYDLVEIINYDNPSYEG